MAYGQSKLANLLHAKELSRRLKVFFQGILIVLSMSVTLSGRVET
jgi:hypothetical protein